MFTTNVHKSSDWDTTVSCYPTMSDRAPLNRLSAETRAKLRSTQILTSLPQVVSELLQNSIDSGASQIDIGVDCEDWSCWVRDNGSGFSKDGLAQIAKASEDGRYGTLCTIFIASVDTKNLAFLQ